MVRIERPAIRADIEQIAVGLEPFLAMAVAVRTERLQVAKEKQLLVASMGLDVVCHGGWSDHASGFAHGAEGMFPELRLASAYPCRAVIQMVPAAGLL